MADPQGVLGEIVAAKRAEIEQRFRGVGLDALRSRAMRTACSLAAALEQRRSRFILEIKKASPSAGAIRPGADAAALARGYGGVADALSVLTDRRFFGGSLDDVRAARREFAGPILAKDFFIDLRQVAEARIAGADAILVMLSVLGDDEARAMIAEAARLGMDSLVEVHDESEMRRALALGAPLIGINNRDLRTLEVDLAATERLAPMARARLLVAESGIGGRAEVERLAGTVDAFLVGSALMRADDPGDAARGMVFGRVKLCGLNRAEDFGEARAATHAGLILVPGSPRAVNLGQALRLARLHRRPVGIFRDAPAGDVAHAAILLGLSAVQLHGDEDDDYVRLLARRVPPGCEIWKAVTVGRRPPAGSAAADRLLFDSGPGGTGRTFDWTLMRGDGRLPEALVAGGIGPHNARAAMALGAYAIDVGSAVDETPGIKSAGKIAALFDALRPAGRQKVRACA